MNTTEQQDAIQAPRICSTCGATMQQVTARAWICPNQKDQGNGISAERRESVRMTAQARVNGLPF